MIALAAWTFITFSLFPFFAAALGTQRGEQILGIWLALGSLLCLHQVLTLPS